MRFFMRPVIMFVYLLSTPALCLASLKGDQNDGPESKTPSGLLRSVSAAPLPEELTALPATSQSSLGVMGGIKLFFTSLFEPFINDQAQAFYHTQWEAMQHQGVVGYGKDLVMTQAQWAKDHPMDAVLDTVSLSGAVILGHTNIAATYPQLLTAYQTLGIARPVAAVFNDLPSQDARKWLPRLLEASAYSVTLYLVSQLPMGAEAASFNSYADARRTYSGYGCPIDQQIVSDATDVGRCLAEPGSTLEMCRTRLPNYPGLEKDLYVFTRHPHVTNPSLDPVSVTRLDLNQTCIQSALSPNTPVTQICYKGELIPTSAFKVTRLNDLTLSQGHEGLESGESARHLGIRHGGYGCGLFNKAQTTYDLGKQPLCFKSATERGGPVTQLCVDPARPEVMTVKEVTSDTSLIFPDDGSPAFQVIVPSRKSGIDIHPDDGRAPTVKLPIFDPLTQCALNATRPHHEVCMALPDSNVRALPLNNHGTTSAVSTFDPLTQCALNGTRPRHEVCPALSDVAPSLPLNSHGADDPLTQFGLSDAPNLDTEEARASSSFSDADPEEFEDEFDLIQELSSLATQTANRFQAIYTKWSHRKWWFQRQKTL